MSAPAKSDAASLADCTDVTSAPWKARASPVNFTRVVMIFDDEHADASE